MHLFDEEYFRRRRRRLVFNRRLLFLRQAFWNRVIKDSDGRRTILDLGCGEGLFLSYAVRAGYRAFGADISALALETAKETGVPVVLCDATAVPFGDETFEIVTCFDVLEHLRDPSVALREIGRVLRRGGLFVMSTPNTTSIGRKWKGENWFAYQDVTHVSLLSPKDWSEALHRAQLLPVKEFWDVLWDPPYFRRIPRGVQLVVFKPLLPLFYLGLVAFPWKCLGENIYFVCRKA